MNASNNPLVALIEQLRPLFEAIPEEGSAADRATITAAYQRFQRHVDAMYAAFDEYDELDVGPWRVLDALIESLRRETNHVIEYESDDSEDWNALVTAISGLNGAIELPQIRNYRPKKESS